MAGWLIGFKLPATAFRCAVSGDQGVKRRSERSGIVCASFVRLRTDKGVVTEYIADAGILPHAVQDAMTTPAVPTMPLCFICKKPVALENSATDSNGKAVHEECYILALKHPTPGPVLS